MTLILHQTFHKVNSVLTMKKKKTKHNPLAFHTQHKVIQYLNTLMVQIEHSIASLSIIFCIGAFDSGLVMRSTGSIFSEVSPKERLKLNESE